MITYIEFKDKLCNSVREINDIGQSVISFLKSNVEVNDKFYNLILEFLSEEDQSIIDIENYCEERNIDDQSLIMTNNLFISVSDLLNQIQNNINDSDNNDDITITLKKINSDESYQDENVILSEYLTSLKEYSESTNTIISACQTLVSSAHDEEAEAIEILNNINTQLSTSSFGLSSAAISTIENLKPIILDNHSDVVSKLSNVISYFMPEIKGCEYTVDSGKQIIFELASEQNDKFIESGFSGKNAISGAFQWCIDKIVSPVINTTVDFIFNCSKAIIGGFLSFTKWGYDSMKSAIKWIDNNIFQTDDVSTNKKYQDLGFDSFSEEAEISLTNSDYTYWKQYLSEEHFTVIPSTFVKKYVNIDSTSSAEKKLHISLRPQLVMTNSQTQELNTIINTLMSDVTYNDSNFVNYIVSLANSSNDKNKDFSTISDYYIYSIIDKEKIFDFYWNLFQLFKMQLKDVHYEGYENHGYFATYLDAYIGTINPVHYHTSPYIINFITSNLNNFSHIQLNPSNYDLVKLICNREGTDAIYYSEKHYSDFMSIINLINSNASVYIGQGSTIESAVNQAIYATKPSGWSDKKFAQFLNYMLCFDVYRYSYSLRQSAVIENTLYYPYYQTYSLEKGKYHINTDDENISYILKLSGIAVTLIGVTTAVVIGFKTNKVINNKLNLLKSNSLRLQQTIGTKSSSGIDITADLEELRKTNLKSSIISKVFGKSQQVIGTDIGSSTAKVLSKITDGNLPVNLDPVINLID